jgi:hypothetical protein
MTRHGTTRSGADQHDVLREPGTVATATEEQTSPRGCRARRLGWHRRRGLRTVTPAGAQRAFLDQASLRSMCGYDHSSLGPRVARGGQGGPLSPERQPHFGMNAYERWLGDCRCTCDSLIVVNSPNHLALRREVSWECPCGESFGVGLYWQRLLNLFIDCAGCSRLLEPLIDLPSRSAEMTRTNLPTGCRQAVSAIPAPRLGRSAG